MPVELTAFTADRRIRGAIPLADDRLSDMLNSVPRVVIRAAEVVDLVNGGPPQLADVTLVVGSVVAVLSSGRRGVEARRRRTDVHRARVGLLRFVVSGSIHLAPGSGADLTSHQPALVLAGRDLLVPFTDATITYDLAGDAVSESFETILVNRAHAVWIDLDDAADGDDAEMIGGRPKVYHASMVKDLTGLS
jgi:hypothetical protein